MDRRRHAPSTTPAARWLIAAAVTLAAGCAAPAPRTYPVGSSARVLAVIEGRNVGARLPEGVPVVAILAAADHALETSGYTVTARDTTALRGRVVARPPDSRLGRRVTVTAEQRGLAAELVVASTPPDPALNFAVLERMLTRLGL